MNLKHNQPGQDGHPDPKEVPKTQHTEDTQLSGEMGNRHFREETTSAKEDTREPENLGRACSRSMLPSNTQQEQCGTLTKPQRPRWGGRQHSLWLSPTSGHVRRAGVSSSEGMGEEKHHGAGPHSCSHQQPHIIGLQFTGQGLVQNQDLEEQQQPTISSQDPPS